MQNIPLSTLQFDVLKITLGYIPPLDLPKIFASHQLNFNIKFKYNASKHNLNFDTFNIIFELFPNIMLKGININCDYHETSPHVPLHKISIVKIRGNTTHILNPNALQNYLSISKLHITNCIFTDTSLIPLMHYTKLSFIEFDNCYHTSNYSSLQNYPNLQTIRFSGVITTELMSSLSKCPSLKTIELGRIDMAIKLNMDNIFLKNVQSIKLLYPAGLVSTNFLKTLVCNHLHLKQFITHPLAYHPLEIIQTCYTLTHLTIKFQEKLDDLSLLQHIPLQQLIIIYIPTPYISQNHIIDISPLRSSKTLKSIKLINCTT